MRHSFSASSLFNIFINVIMDDLKGLDTKVFGLVECIARFLFVDKLVLWEKAVEEVKDMLQWIHERAYTWAMKCGIDKCKGMVILDDQDEVKQHDLMFGMSENGICDIYRYLGIELYLNPSISIIIKEREVARNRVMLNIY